MPTNGNLSDTLLVSVDGKLVSLAAAPYVRAMFDAMEDDGVGRPFIRWGYRTLAEQVEMREEYGTGAALPGTSNHGWGNSLDLASGPAPHWYALTRAQLAWLRRRADDFGFDEDVPGESWHWTFRLKPTIKLNNPAAAPEEADDPMNHIRGLKLADGRFVVQNLADHTYYEVGSTSQWNYLKALGLKLVSGPQAVSVISGFRKI